MPLPIILNTFRCALHWTDPAFQRAAVSVMHFEAVGADIDDVWTSLDGHVTGAMWGQAKNTTVIDTVTITDLGASLASVVKTTGGAAKWKGTSGTGTPVPQVAVILKLLTAGRGRSFRGRNFLPWPVEDAITAGTYDSGYRTPQQTAWNNFLTAMGADNVNPVVASYKLASSELVTTYQVEQLLGTQRKRQPRP